MKKRQAFTLMEIMIAIVVFSIGVLAVLRVLTGDLSLMDRTDMKLQSTVFGKEGLELLYNVRDSNFEKELPRNCIMGQGIYSLDQSQMSIDIESNNSICSGYFSPGKIVQLGFNEDYYMTQNVTGVSDDFDTLFEDNQLCIFTGDIAGNTGMFWYSYCSQGDGEPTFFARYLSFTGVDISDPTKIDQSQTILSKDKILKVESHVLYKKGHNTGEYVFESFIGNY